MAAAIAAEAMPVEHPEPFRGACPSCSADVLIVELADGHDVVLEPREVMPRHRCPICAQIEDKGHRRSDCVRCGLTGYLGERLPDVGGVRVDGEGVGRAYRGRRGEYEAVHRRHVCAS